MNDCNKCKDYYSSFLSMTRKLAANKLLMAEALGLLEKSRDQLLLKPEDRIKMGEISEFVSKCRKALNAADSQGKH